MASRVLTARCASTAGAPPSVAQKSDAVTASTQFSVFLPKVRAACDDYVALVRERSLVEAVASSLTELFAPDLMARRIAAWERS